MWAQAAFMGLNLIGGFMTSNAQAAASKAQAREGAAQAKAKQEEANANSELARQIKRINNIRMMQAADKNVAAQASNIERMRKDFTQGNISAQIAASEAMGAYTAHTASKGVGGSTSKIIESTMNLRNAVQTEITERNQGLANYDAVKVLAGIVPTAVAQQDMTVINGGVSNAVAIPEVRPGFNYLDALGKTGVLQFAADWLSPSSTSGSTGTGLKLSGDVGLSAPRTGFFSSSTVKLL